MSINNNLPDYQELFGALDFKEGDKGRSVYSPAAYLSDLLQMMEDKFSDPDFFLRRDDVRDILLNGENTFSIIPYLSIVNDVLEKRIKTANGNQDPYEVLKEASHPLETPFDLTHETLHKYLGFLGVDPVAFQRLFATEMDEVAVATMQLGLSHTATTFLTNSASKSDDDIRNEFQVAADEPLSVLQSAPRFMVATGLTGAEVIELLSGNLSQSALDETELSERERAGELFINLGTGGYAWLDEKSEEIKWSDAEEIPIVWYERVSKFIRLSKWTNQSFTDLDLILRTCTDQHLTDDSLMRMAVVLSVSEKYELPIEVVVALFEEMNNFGMSGGDAPADLFNQVFNGRMAELDQKIIADESGYVPVEYVEFADFEQLGDILATENKELRVRIRQALHLSAKDLEKAITDFREKAEEENRDTIFNGTFGPEAFGLLFRLNTLVEVLDISMTDLLDMLEILSHDINVRLLNHFNLQLFEGGELDTFQILESGDRSSRFWLIQTLLSMGEWMQKADFPASDLKKITLGLPEEEKDQEKRIAFLNSTWESIREELLSAATLQKTGLSGRLSRLLEAKVMEYHQSAMPQVDARLVTYEKLAGQSLGYQVLTTSGEINEEDLMELSLGAALGSKLYSLLVVHGFLDLTGGLVASAWPENADEFSFSTDFQPLQEKIFEIIASATRLAETERFEDDPIEVSIFLSDFEALELPIVELEELYDNLQFNQYIDEQGAVIAPEYFNTSTFPSDFKTNSGLENFGQKVYEFIQERRANFVLHPLTVLEDSFDELPLKSIEKADLIENLIFNEYLDDDKSIILKEEILASEELTLAIQYYPFRHQILEILQSRISDFRSNYLSFREETFSPLTDGIAGALAFEIIRSEYLEENGFSNAGEAFFLSQENSGQVAVPSFFSMQDQGTLFAGISSILGEARSIRLLTTDFATLSFTDEETSLAFEELAVSGMLETNGGIPLGNLAYFLNVNSALSFQVLGFEDFNKDIFFLIHAKAKILNERIEAIDQALQLVSTSQENILLSSLSEHLEISPESSGTLLSKMFRGTTPASAMFLTPILSAVNPLEEVTEIPTYRGFDLSLGRMEQFAMLASSLGLKDRMIEIFFEDQDLADKFPERIVIPEELESIDAVLEYEDNQLLLFYGEEYWTFDNDSGELLEEAKPLTELSEVFAGIQQIHAAFVDPEGNKWIISGDQYAKQVAGEDRWAMVTRQWGKLEEEFDQADGIQASYVDSDGFVYLFAGDQYMRYAGGMGIADEGYPKSIREHWKIELEGGELLPEYEQGIDAGFQDEDGIVYLFKGTQFIRSSAPTEEAEISEEWGKVENQFDNLTSIDAVVDHRGQIAFFKGDQMMVYQDSIEQSEVFAVEGSPLKLETVFAEADTFFHDDLSAGFSGTDDSVYLFKEDKFINISEASDSEGIAFEAPSETKATWGKVVNTLWDTGEVSAAFHGLDGKTYLFSGTQYYRYSGTNYKFVDEGYPKTIAPDWGGLETVDAAFVLDGKTYLFQYGEEASGSYVRFSTRDYSEVDEEYPKIIDDNWWNLPASLVQEGFDTPDAVFVGLDKKTYLFLGERFIHFDHNHRWWSGPLSLAEDWDSMPLVGISAGFTGKDGKSYLFGIHNEEFSETRFVRYTDETYQRIDDRFPKPVLGNWGRVLNNIQRTGKVDAALTLVSTIVEENDEGIEEEFVYHHTYLFSGNQFFRYVDGAFDAVEEGYPLLIKTSLALEPRFQNLKAECDDGIDGIWADEGQVYLFKENQVHVISSEETRNYDFDQNIGTPHLAFREEGSLYFETESDWFHVGHPESGTFYGKAAKPRVLREVPTEYQTGLSSMLTTRAGQTFLFQGETCYDVSLKSAYPTAEAWGKVRNNVQDSGWVDAGFSGKDGKFYLFSGDQFLTYLLDKDTPETIPELAEGIPGMIEETWAGLPNVSTAFIRDGKTYLTSAPDEDGYFSVLCFSGDDYSTPDAGYPKTVDFSWWEVPKLYVEEGFDRVDGVIADEDNVILFKENEFVQFDIDANVWTYARPIEQMWRNFPYSHPDFDTLNAVVKGPDDTLYFFEKEHFVDFTLNGFGQLTAVEERWGNLENLFISSGIIDAAIALESGTYLFSGSQYVRYTEESLEFVDVGYPKEIAGNLRKEVAFSALSVSLEDQFEAIEESGESIQFVFADAGSVFMMINGILHSASEKVSRSYEISHIGKIRNEIERTGKIDAAFVGASDALYLLSGDQYVRYSQGTFDYVDEGYPRLIDPGFESEEFQSSVPEEFTWGIDAAVKTSDSFFLFKKDQYLKLGTEPEIGSISDFWQLSFNAFVSPDEDTNVTIDTAFISPDGALYVFKDGMYIRYSNPMAEYMDAGYPRSIKDHWGNMDIEFENSFSSAFVFDGKTYFRLEDEVIRYSDPTYQKMDAGYPQIFYRTWGPWSDYQLVDIQIMHKIKELIDHPTGSDLELINFLHDGEGYNKEPFEFLAEFFDWDVEDVKWVKKYNGFLPFQDFLTQEEDFSLELLIRIEEIMRESARIGSYPQDLYQNLWQPLFQDNNQQYASDTLYRILGNNNQGEDWEVLTRQIRDELNTIKRDALVPYTVKHTDGIENIRDLFELLLLDTEMESCAETSYIKEAAAAIQLYFHRYFVNLELIDPIGERDEETRNQMKEQWAWMKNYRVWEANRKVFLYPENYIRPELRDSKTPAFQTLEDELLQGDISDELVERVYRNYLQEYTEVSRLTIAGGYVYDDPDSLYSKELILFGHTKSDPKQYYFRSAAFINADSDDVTWEPWSKLEVEINATKVYPVYAFGRVFVFWTTSEAVNKEDQTTTLQTKDDDGKMEVSNVGSVEFHVKVYFSYYDLNNQWVQPQLLNASMVEQGNVFDISLFVENSEKINGDPHENILINCGYKYWHWEWRNAGGFPYVHFENRTRSFAYSLTSELTVTDAALPATRTEELDVFQSLFAVEEWGDLLKDGNIVQLNTLENSSDGPWFSFDHKGGSFLVKPRLPGLTGANDPREFSGNTLIPDWDRIDAAFAGPDDRWYFFNNEKQVYQEVGFAEGSDGRVLLPEQPISSRWGRIHNEIISDNLVDAAWNNHGDLYIFREGEYLLYDDSVEFASKDGLKALSSGGNGLPSWASMDAVLNDGAGGTYFFNGTQFAHSSNLSDLKNISDQWGISPTSFTDSSQVDRPVDAAFVIGNHTYLINNSEFVRYDGSDYSTYESGYPKSSDFFNILEDLGCTNNADAHKNREVTGAYNQGADVFFFVDDSDHFKLAGSTVTALSSGEDYFASVDVEGSLYLVDSKTFNFNDSSGTPVTLSTSGSINAALLGLDGQLYFFSGHEYFTMNPQTFHNFAVQGKTGGEFTTQLFNEPLQLTDKWGTSPDNIFQSNGVSAAFNRGNQLFLFAGDQYVRYSDAAILDHVDDGYPKAISTNSDSLPAWTGMDAVLTDVEGETHFFFQGEYSTSENLTVKNDINTRWGLIGNNILFRGVDSAYSDGDQFYLFSGKELSRYTKNSSGELNPDMDPDYPIELDIPSTPFTHVQAAFTYVDDLYLISDHSFVCCPANDPEKIRPGYPKPGKFGAAVRDLFQRNGKTFAYYGYFDTLNIEGAYVDGNELVIQTDWRIFWTQTTKIRIKISLDTGQFTAFDWGLYFTTAYQTGSGLVSTTSSEYTASVVAGDALLLFKGGDYMILDNIPASFDAITWDAEEATVQSIWGSPTIDGGVKLKDKIYLFSYDRYFKFNAGTQPADFSRPLMINGNWANLPNEFQSGIDAALSTEDFVWLFKDRLFSEFESGSAMPYEISDSEYDMIRLTTGTASELNKKLFAEGVSGLLSLDTQETDESPGFSFTESKPGIIKVNQDMVALDGIPQSHHLDFNSANGIYYWELFFHVPHLIAQSLNTGQKFEESKKWSEYIFDPTETGEYWKFLPFLSVDVAAIIQAVEVLLEGMLSYGVEGVTIDADEAASLANWEAHDVVTSFDTIFGLIGPMEDAFQGIRLISEFEEDTLTDLAEGDHSQVDLSVLETSILALSPSSDASETIRGFNAAKVDLLDQVKLIFNLSRNFGAMLTSSQQLDKYLNDPFDPHAIASLRKIAYRKAIVMSYIDNIMDWADALFTRYTMESIDEARMLYILAYDLLGRKPEGLGKLILSDDESYKDLFHDVGDYDFLMFLENTASIQETDLSFSGSAHDSIIDKSYFYIPENEQFLEYWDRVEDRLYKIRHCLNIFGVKQPLPLFQPPIDPAALVRAASGGGGFGAALEGMSVPVPHYRFTFMHDKAEALVQKLNQFSGELLAALEKKDSESLSLLQTQQEKEIFALTLEVREAQLMEAKYNLDSLKKSKENATERKATYAKWRKDGLSGWEIGQMSVMGGAVIAHGVSAVSRIIASVGAAAPDALVGPFIMGVKYGGGNANDIFNSVAEVSQSIAEGLSIGGEIMGIVGQHERMQDEWLLQQDLAGIDEAQIDLQIKGAEYQIKAAEQEVAILKKQLKQNESMSNFLKNKFTNKELYNWMAGKLSGLYYQTYKMALDMARYAEKAFQYERGLPENQASYIRGYYWDSQRKGLLAGDSLGLDLDRMEKAFVETDKRRFEIGKEFSLLDHDPLAFLKLKATGVCEFDLPESMFDYDFPGHYCRQMKTISLAFDAGEGVYLNATLTQLQNRVVMEPDPKAVKFLLKPSDQPPVSIRTNWNAHQQIALSHHDEFEKNNGLFELRFDSEKYLPFEGTGAVSSWRLEINGKKGSFNSAELVDIIVNLKYTALQGGEAFASAVRGMLKPYEALRYFDLNYDFHNEWLRFLQNEEKELTLTFSRDQFPNMGSSKINGIFTQFETETPGGISAVLNGDSDMTLKDRKITDTSGLSIRSKGSELTFTFKGDKANLRNVLLVMNYKATV